MSSLRSGKAIKNLASTSIQFGTPANTSNVSLTLSPLEDRLSKQHEALIETLRTQIAKIRTDFLSTIADLEKTWAARFENVNSTLANVIGRVESIEANAETKVLKEKLLDVNNHIDTLERKEIAADAVLFGVPVLDDENLESYINTLCNTINCTPPVIRNIFRAKSRSANNRRPPPIVVQFSKVHDRNSVLHAAAVHRKNQRRELCLHDAGINSDVSCYINESLTKTNRALLQGAVRFKHSKQLFAVHTHKGSVFIKLTERGQSFPVKNSEALYAIVNNGRQDD